MKTSCRFVAFSVAALLSAMPLRAQAPSLIEQNEGSEGPPLWISAEAVADEKKIINFDLIHSLALKEIVERQRQELGDRIPSGIKDGEKPTVATIPAAACKSSSFLRENLDEGSLRNPLASLATYSKSIIRGTVRTVDSGFASGFPSSLIGVEVSEVIKGPSPESPLYVHYPVAHFRIGPYHFCNLNEGFEPSPGDEALFFIGTGPIDSDHVLYALQLDDIFFQSQSGSLILPPSLKNDPDLKTLRSFDEVVGRLAPLLAASETRPRAQALPIREPEAEKLQAPLQQPTLWISAEAVADEHKIINLGLINSYSLEKDVERQRRELGDRISTETSGSAGKPTISSIPASECKSSSFIMDERGGGGRHGTLAELGTYSKSIVRGSVRTVDPGFYLGTPSSRIGVEVSAVIKGPSPESPFYIDYPVARFRIGPYEFCNSAEGFEPSPGDEVLLFDYTGPVGGDQALYIPLPEQIFFQSQSGAFFIPPSIKNAPDLKTLQSLDEVAARLNALLASKDAR